MRSSDLAGRRLLIFGTGREGMASAASLKPVAGSLIAVDDHDGDSAAAWRQAWGSSIPLLIAPTADELSGVEVVIASPGVSPLNPLLIALRAAGVAFTSGTDLWMSEHAAHTTAVTGSKGKSTTASLIQHLTVALGGESMLGGNIGIPLLSLPASDRYVVELSSQQTWSLTTSPDVVVLTSLFPEHLDWHGSEEQYYADKLNILVGGPRHVIVNGEDERLMRTLAELHSGVSADLVGVTDSWHIDDDGWIVGPGSSLLPSSELAILGRHNALNACLALAAVEALGIPIEPGIARAALAGFEPLEHRLEPIADVSGLTFVNDSLSTSPYATIEALKALGSSGVTLLVGGLDRGVDYGPLRDYLAEHPVAELIGLPVSGEHILEVLAPAGIPSAVASNMAEAVDLARRVTPPGGTVLLSPAAPSYGVYRDFAERAADFRRAIAATA